MVSRGYGGVGAGIGTDTYTLINTYKTDNKDFLYSTGNSTQYSVMVYLEMNLKKSGHMYPHN